MPATADILTNHEAGLLDLASVFPPGCYAFRVSSVGDVPNLAVGDIAVCVTGSVKAGDFAVVDAPGGRRLMRVLAKGDGRKLVSVVRSYDVTGGAR